MPLGSWSPKWSTDRIAPGAGLLKQPPPGAPHFRVRRVTTAGEERHPKRVRHALEHAHQRVLLEPDFDVVGLILPQVEPELCGHGFDNLLRRLPRAERTQVAGAVLDGTPVDQAGAARIADDGAEPLVVLLSVRQQVPAHELIIQLPQGELVALCGVRGTDLVRVFNDREGGGLERLRFIADERHGGTVCGKGVPPCGQCWRLSFFPAKKREVGSTDYTGALWSHASFLAYVKGRFSGVHPRVRCGLSNLQSAYLRRKGGLRTPRARVRVA